MKFQFSQIFKQYVLQFADLYHKYKVESEKLQKTKYSIHSSLLYYKNTGMVQLSFNDRPGDMLPPMSILDIKNTPDILAGLHPIDVNSINDLHYISQDEISQITVNDNIIQVIYKNGKCNEFDINHKYDHENLASKRISFLIGYMQAEKLMRDAYTSKDKYKVVRDNISTLEVLDLETGVQFLKKPMDILFSDDYKNFSKEDVSKIGYICGQMSKI